MCIHSQKGFGELVDAKDQYPVLGMMSTLERDQKEQQCDPPIHVLTILEHEYTFADDEYKRY